VMLGIKELGLLAPTPCAPELPIPHVRDAEINVSCRSFLYTSPLRVMLD
jgi:hypothetical protein